MKKTGELSQVSQVSQTGLYVFQRGQRGQRGTACKHKASGVPRRFLEVGTAGTGAYWIPGLLQDVEGFSGVLLLGARLKGYFAAPPFHAARPWKSEFFSLTGGVPKVTKGFCQFCQCPKQKRKILLSVPFLRHFWLIRLRITQHRFVGGRGLTFVPPALQCIPWTTR
jgi:hypothetical protein